METEEGFNRALNYNETIKLHEFSHYRTFLHQKIDVKVASEPTDIIWENRHLKSIQRFYRRCVVYLVILAMLYLSFQIVFNLQKKSLSMKGRYPKMQCQDYIEQYQNRRSQWMKDAFYEYITRTN